jgi:hypothetical protein
MRIFLCLFKLIETKHWKSTRCFFLDSVFWHTQDGDPGRGLGLAPTGGQPATQPARTQQVNMNLPSERENIQNC